MLEVGTYVGYSGISFARVSYTFGPVLTLAHHVQPPQCYLSWAVDATRERCRGIHLFGVQQSLRRHGPNGVRPCRGRAGGEGELQVYIGRTNLLDHHRRVYGEHQVAAKDSRIGAEADFRHDLSGSRQVSLLDRHQAARVGGTDRRRECACTEGLIFRVRSSWPTMSSNLAIRPTFPTSAPHPLKRELHWSSPLLQSSQILRKTLPPPLNGLQLSRTGLYLRLDGRSPKRTALVHLATLVWYTKARCWVDGTRTPAKKMLVKYPPVYAENRHHANRYDDARKPLRRHAAIVCSKCFESSGGRVASVGAALCACFVSMVGEAVCSGALPY